MNRMLKTIGLEAEGKSQNMHDASDEPSQTSDWKIRYGARNLTRPLQGHRICRSRSSTDVVAAYARHLSLSLSLNLILAISG